jgi:hypothetical protein
VQSLYLEVRGASQPAEPPEIYFRFTKRTLERHGGVALGSSWHKGTAVLDNGVWRADLRAVDFGTVEVFSRAVLDGQPAYSQTAYLHFVRPEDVEGQAPEPVCDPPQGWPSLVFPTNTRNGMPFRGLQTEDSTTFEIAAGGERIAGERAFLAEATPARGAGSEASFDPEKALWTVSPPDDPTLKVTSGPLGGTGESKLMAVVAELPGGGTAAYTLNVTRSRWSYRKLGTGAGILAFCGVSAGLMAWRRRKGFKYNGYEGPGGAAGGEGTGGGGSPSGDGPAPGNCPASGNGGAPGGAGDGGGSL